MRKKNESDKFINISNVDKSDSEDETLCQIQLSKNIIKTTEL